MEAPTVTRDLTIAHNRCQLCARCYLGGEITRQDQAKITRQEKITPIVFLNAASLFTFATNRLSLEDHVFMGLVVFSCYLSKFRAFMVLPACA